MNGAELTAFVDEFRKVAEVEAADPNRKWELAQQVAKNVGQGAVGYGLGYGAGHLFDKVVLPKLIGQRLTPGKRQLLTSALGAMGGIGTLAMRQAFNEAQRKVEDVKAGGHSTGV